MKRVLKNWVVESLYIIAFMGFMITTLALNDESTMSQVITTQIIGWALLIGSVAIVEKWGRR